MSKLVGFKWEGVIYNAANIVHYEQIKIDYTDEVKHYVTIKFNCTVKRDAVGAAINILNIRCDDASDSRTLLSQINSCFEFPQLNI